MDEDDDMAIVRGRMEPAAHATQGAIDNIKLPMPVSMLLRVGLNMGGVSDYHFDEGLHPGWRKDGRLVRYEQLEPSTREDLRELVVAVKGNPDGHGDALLRTNGELFRINYDQAYEGLSVVMRHVRSNSLKLADLGVPDKAAEIIRGLNGLFTLNGKAGKGKSTTMNAFIDMLNDDGEGLSITILGDPIEYFHQNRSARIRHREFGKHFESWENQLESILRQDPDVICLTEVRNFETMKMALTAADTGHLVITTFHAPSAPAAVARCLEMAPRTARDHQLALLTQAWRGSLWQTLLPRVGGGRVAGYELLVNTTAVCTCIREDRYKQLEDEMFRGSTEGMVNLDSSLQQLFERNEISRDTALKAARNPDQLEPLIPL